MTWKIFEKRQFKNMDSRKKYSLRSLKIYPNKHTCKTTLKENDSRGVPIVAQWIKNPATIHEDLSLIPTFAQWDKVLALP